MKDAKEETRQGFVFNPAILRKQAARSGFPIPAPTGRRMLRNINRRSHRRFVTVVRANRDRLWRGEISADDHIEFINRAVMEKIQKCEKVFLVLAISKAVEKAITKGGRAALRIQSRRQGMAIASSQSMVSRLFRAEDGPPTGHAMPSQTRAAWKAFDGSKIMDTSIRLGTSVDRCEPGQSAIPWATCSGGFVEFGPVTDLKVVKLEDDGPCRFPVRALTTGLTILAKINDPQFNWAMIDRLQPGGTILENPS